jgi:glycosyltransferase involved in cell wall biosynthesis
MGICLNMIVKNETKNLERLFASVYKYIDHFIISDTGSTDNTIELIYELSKLYNIPGKVVSHPWIGFGPNRQLVLEAAMEAKEKGEHECRWLFIIDADEELKVNEKLWKENLEYGVSYTTYKKMGGIIFKHTFLLWVEGQNWQWNGNIHGYLTNDTPLRKKGHLNSVRIIAHQSEGAKTRQFDNSKEKYQHDLDQLLEELQNAVISEKNINRFWQLAFVYLDVNNIDAAINVFKSITTFEPVSSRFHYISLVFIAKYIVSLNIEGDEPMQYLKMAIEFDPLRKEAYYYLASINRKRGDFKQAKDILEFAENLSYLNPQVELMEEDIYVWKIKYELAFVYFHLAEYAAAEKIVDKLIEEDNVPEIEYMFLQSFQKKIATIVSSDAE